MIKKGMKNRKNRRMKKAVRRTFGAFFMASAIIVAAIPFPDAAAVGEEGIVIQADEIHLAKNTNVIDTIFVCTCYIIATVAGDISPIIQNDFRWFPPLSFVFLYLV